MSRVNRTIRELVDYVFKDGRHTTYEFEKSRSKIALEELKPVAYLIEYRHKKKLSHTYAMVIEDVATFQKNHPEAILKPLVLL